ncbi:MAG: PEP-CTERM sorting domain-containing protein [Planctomycetota bacterium]
MQPKLKLVRPSRHYFPFAAYLFVIVGIGAIATTCDAAVVGIDVSALTSDNGGVAFGEQLVLEDFAGVGGGSLIIANGYQDLFTGISGGAGLTVAAGPLIVTPAKFVRDEFVDSSLYFTDEPSYSVFKYGDFEARDFRPIGFALTTYMGFQTSQGNFGWLQVSWDSATNIFRISAAAYETVAGVPIRTGDDGLVHVPEPSSVALFAMLMGGIAVRQWRKRRPTTNQAVA